MTNFENEPMLDIYIYETTMFLDQMEQVIINCEKIGYLNDEAINEIFRFMHTIKGSSAMMLFNNIAQVAHQLEDVFYFIRENKPNEIDFSTLSDLTLSVVDFVKVEVNKIKNNDRPDGEPDSILKEAKAFLDEIKKQNNVEETSHKPESPVKQQYYIQQEKKIKENASNFYHAVIHFDEGCEMENIRSYTVIFALTDLVDAINYFPPDIVENEHASEIIRENGFVIYIRSSLSLEALNSHLSETIFLKSLELFEISEDEFNESHELKRPISEPIPIETDDSSSLEASTKDIHTDNNIRVSKEAKDIPTTTSSSMISVNVEKLDILMNTVGELVIAEAMVTQNPIISSIDSESFQKSSRLLHKITGELQDMVMSIRMVPLSTTFVKMHRIVRDMSKKLEKDVTLDLFGEETEVDKNIIEKISDPLMHLIRNAIDHGIETEEERLESGKSKTGHIVLGAKNAGGDVLIIIKDDGKGLNKERIIKKAMENGVLERSPSDMSDREIFNLILLPGFSTKEKVTEFSGRGVGMDVVAKNIASVGGTVIVESEEGLGTTMTLKIPLTLAIIEGMNLKVGESRFTIPITAIKESFRPKSKDIIIDPNQNEMVMVRGECYPVLRIHSHYKVKKAITQFEEGIMIMVEYDEKIICLFADELLGQQQVVVKSLPNYINSIKKIIGIAGCTLLGDGSISLILDISGFAELRIR
ncbi:chemotaxis protein CheW [Fusibacter bizertensis]